MNKNSRIAQWESIEARKLDLGDTFRFGEGRPEHEVTEMAFMDVRGNIVVRVNYTGTPGRSFLKVQAPLERVVSPW